MNNLQLYQNDGLEIVINTQTGESFCSISAFARMVGKHDSSIRYWITAQKIKTISHEIQTVTGFKPALLLDELEMTKGFKKWKPEMEVMYEID